MNSSLIQFQNFIVATRDSGYKNTSSAIAELIDNSIEARATKIVVNITKANDDSDSFELCLIDNGKGMSADELNLALQFGGSSRFNSRSHFGRYGMGLPNSSLSQCKRVEVISWQSKKECFCNYLDIDEIVLIKQKTLLKPKKTKHPESLSRSTSGTIVIWKKCDRLSFKYLKTLLKHIHFELGRIFRNSLWNGVEIILSGEKVLPFDPLFLQEGTNLTGGVKYGEDLTYVIKVPGDESRYSNIKVTFVELPVPLWAKMSNDEKRKCQITNCSGVTIVRSGREIDYGWFFMGNKRKENYDDWWRCEISFDPDLDELFGVTHTKQEIKQTELLSNILSPDLELIARTLNNRVRLKFIELKSTYPQVHAKTVLERSDGYMRGVDPVVTHAPRINNTSNFKGLEYEVILKDLQSDMFYEVLQENGQIQLIINSNHIFYHNVFKVLHDKKVRNTAEFIKILEVLIFAIARSEFLFQNLTEKEVVLRLKKEWSLNIKTFMS